MRDIRVIEQYDKIIEEIWKQHDNMLCRLNIEPNKVIVGGHIYKVLQWGSGAVYHSRAEEDYIAEVLGLRIKVDWDNPYTIEVCYGIDKADIRDLFGVEH